ncbi:hypothetical protein Tco_1010277 [Tanacetum coccineum]
MLITQSSRLNNRQRVTRRCKLEKQAVLKAICSRFEETNEPAASRRRGARALGERLATERLIGGGAKGKTDESEREANENV